MTPTLEQVETRDLDTRLERLRSQSFRAKFHLGIRERAYAQSHGRAAIREHAADVVAKRLAPAMPYRDGKQTPYRGHPVFVAQHATATCCRTCLQRWHDIPKGRPLTPDERAYVVEVILRWVARDLARDVGQPNEIRLR